MSSCRKVQRDKRSTKAGAMREGFFPDDKNEELLKESMEMEDSLLSWVK